MLDVRTWLLWAISMLAAASLCRNPLYLVLLLLMVLVVDRALAPRTQAGAPAFVKFAAIVVPLAALFNGITVHAGSTPIVYLPDWLPLIGGPLTLEALVYGALNGLALTLILGSFTLINRVTPLHDFVGLAPRAFQAVGIVVTVAVSYVPQTLRSLTRIREAQAVRGHRLRGLKDWLPITIPLLISSLERSMGLAEAMVARGFGAVGDQRQPLRLQGLLILGLLAILVGWMGSLLLPHLALLASAVLLAGVALVLAMLWLAGRAVRRTHYRRRPWTWADILVALASLVALGVLVLPLPWETLSTLSYSPYPRLSWPPFDPRLASILLLLLAPLSTLLRRSPHVAVS